MKMFFVLFAAVSALCTSQQVHAQAASNNISVNKLASTRQFNTSRTDSSVGCTIVLSPSCPPKTGYQVVLYGYTPAGYACCVYRRGSEGADTESTQVVTDTESDNDLSAAFDDSRIESYWGYISTTSRSPNTGRTVSAPARLDACLGYGNVDSQTNWANCYTHCDDTTKNGYCTTTGTNNGVTQTNYVCKDRCDCVWGGGTCENL